MKKYIWWIVSVISIIILILLQYLDCISVSFLIGNEFNLITINTVLVGFLFTVYTILIPLLDEEALKAYTITGEINSIFNNINVGITSGIFSVIFTIVGLAIFNVEEGNAICKLHQIWLSIEISFFLIVMITTLFSIINISSIVEAVRKNKVNKSISNKTNEEMEKRFKK